MAHQLSSASRNAAADSVESTIGTSPKLYIRTGAQPSDCTQADSGSLLATLTLPSDWLSTSSAGVKNLAGTWSGTATGTGTAGHFRIKDSSGTTCHWQGSIGLGTGDMPMDNTNIAINQTINVTSFSLTMGGA